LHRAPQLCRRVHRRVPHGVDFHDDRDDHSSAKSMLFAAARLERVKDGAVTRSAEATVEGEGICVGAANPPLDQRSARGWT
jgi:hypothetical protein